MFGADVEKLAKDAEKKNSIVPIATLSKKYPGVEVRLFSPTSACGLIVAKMRDCGLSYVYALCCFCRIDI